MSRKAFAIVYGCIVTLGLVGVWLGYTGSDSGDFRRWAGMALLLGAAVGLAIVFREDLRVSQREKHIAWQRLKTRGRGRYVIVQVLRSQVIWLPLLFGGALALYRNRTWPSFARPDRSWIVLAAISAAFSFVYSMTWWRRQERRYSSGPSQ
jgi:hypothetical protein